MDILIFLSPRMINLLILNIGSLNGSNLLAFRPFALVYSVLADERHCGNLICVGLHRIRYQMKSYSFVILGSFIAFSRSI